jgi:hypothetical protein
MLKSLFLAQNWRFPQNQRYDSIFAQTSIFEKNANFRTKFLGENIKTITSIPRFTRCGRCTSGLP